MDIKSLDLKKTKKDYLLELCEKSNKVISKSYTKQKLYDILIGETLLDVKDNSIDISKIECKPAIKWAGGKTQLLEKIFNLFPKKINNYFELFIGGGSVLIKLLENKEIKIFDKIFAFDINKVLIGMYKNIQSNIKELIEYLSNYETKYLSIQELNGDRNPKDETEALLSKESYYYWIRMKYNKMNIENKIKPEGSALFIFINKTCFRGLHREGPNGFNVPFGNYIKPDFGIDNLRNLSKLFQNVIFEVMDYKDAFKKISNDDFVYLDPPYVPIDKKSFVKYNECGFDEKEHLELFKLAKTKSFLMSNSNATIVIDNFKDCKINYIQAKRSINSSNPESKTTETLIYNY